MATHDYIIANASGAAVRADLNNALAAIVSNNSNATAPATTYAYQWWADTTANQLKLRNAANDDWIVIQELDGTMLMEDGTAAAPGLAFADDVDTGLFRPAANQLGVATNGVERVEFGTTEVVFNDSGANVDFRVEGDAEANLLFVDAGNDHVGIAESAPGTVLEIGSTEPYVTLKNSTEEDTDGGRESRLIFEGEQSGGEISTLAQIEVSHDGTADDEKGKIVISTNGGTDGASPTERMRITSAGRVLIGKSASDIGTIGIELVANGAGVFTRSDSQVLILNREDSDGTVVMIRQDNNTEGTISVSGTTVSYNGGHLSRWSQLAGGADRTEILRGSVLSNLDEMCEWGEEDNEQLNRMKVSDVEGDVNVAGVFQSWDDDDEIYTNDFYCAMTGDFVIRIAQGTTVARGDLLMSAGDGTAKPQDDDIVRSKTIAKVTSTTVATTYADGSYCVPCVLMAC